MDKFTASNGYRVKSSERNNHNRVEIDLTRNDGYYGQTLVLTIEQHAALREFFLSERDEALGRWRSPEYPEYVVTLHRCGGVRVLNEVTWSIGHFRSLEAAMVASSDLARPAVAYFAAHPAHEVKPWHDAKPGEVWHLELDGFPGGAAIVTFLYGDWMFRFDDDQIPLDAKHIKAGRRIWPKSE